MKALGTVLAIAVMAIFSAAAAEELPSSCCGTLFENESQAVAHMVEHHGKLGCVDCGKLFETRQQMVEHAIEHHGKLGCVKCGKLFESAAEAEAHARSHAHPH